MFTGGEHKFVDHEHIFKDGEHKFTAREYKKCRREKKKGGIIIKKQNKIWQISYYRNFLRR
jgi:hypothetical protein